MVMQESIYIATPDHVTLEFELAGPGSRFSAYVLDFIFNVLLIVIIALALYASGAVVSVRSLLGAAKSGSWGASWILALLVLIVFLINWGYYVLFEGLNKGSTPGKKRVGIRVIRQDGLPIGLREAALRNLVRAADMLPPPSYILGGLVMHFDPQGRRLGDMVAGTCVIVEKFDLAAQGASGAAWASRVEQGRSREAAYPAARRDLAAADRLDRAISRAPPPVIRGAARATGLANRRTAAAPARPRPRQRGAPRRSRRLL